MTRPIVSQSFLVTHGQPPLPVPGETVAEKYRIERTLGRGGMGAVFEVTHCVTHKRFAIKWLLAQTSDTDQDRKRFIREAQIAGRIKHPNVVEVYDIYQQPAGMFLVMELLEGESLATRLERTGRLTVSEALPILIASMEGVAAAHEAGVVHRDIKPANIFLCRGRNPDELHPKVVDFGVSRLATLPGPDEQATTRSGTVLGTPHYMAPEQMRAADVDGRVDVYALGITLYEVLAGVRPYDAATYPELVLQIAAGRARPLDALVPELPRTLSEAVSRAMAPDPDARFPSVHAFRQALLDHTETHGAAPDAAPARSPADAAAPRARRRVWPLVALGLAVLSAAAIGLAIRNGVWGGAAPVSTESAVEAATPRAPATAPAPVAAEPAPAAPSGPVELEAGEPVENAKEGSERGSPEPRVNDAGRRRQRRAGQTEATERPRAGSQPSAAATKPSAHTPERPGSETGAEPHNDAPARPASERPQVRLERSGF